jgi:hypothetical protein
VVPPHVPLCWGYSLGQTFSLPRPDALSPTPSRSLVCADTITTPDGSWDTAAAVLALSGWGYVWSKVIPRPLAGTGHNGLGAVDALREEIDSRHPRVSWASHAHGPYPYPVIREGQSNRSSLEGCGSQESSNERIIPAGDLHLLRRLLAPSGRPEAAFRARTSENSLYR